MNHAIAGRARPSRMRRKTSAPSINPALDSQDSVTSSTIPQFAPNWVAPSWGNYYTQSDEGFNPWVYFQNTCDYIPQTTTSKYRYTIELVRLLIKEGQCIARKEIHLQKNETGLTHGYYLYKDVIIFVYYRGEGSDYEYLAYHHPDRKVPTDDFIPFIKKETENRISVLLQNKYEGYVAEPCDVKVPESMDIGLNYGDAFIARHADLVDKLKTSSAGLFILFGSPGSGKSTMIKHLTSLVKREFIYVPVGMVSHLASPDMMAFLLTKKNSILVLEDAEKAVRTREDNHDSSVVSTLLNLTDGILGNVLNISIIATYNAERETVDKAFLRKGRLKFEHEFKALTLDETNRLLNHLKQPVSNKPLTLADIYYISESTGHVEPVQRSMGFGS